MYMSFLIQNTVRNTHLFFVLHKDHGGPNCSERAARCSPLPATTLSHNKLAAGQLVLAKQRRRRQSRRRRLGGRNSGEHFATIANQVRIVLDVDRVGVETS